METLSIDPRTADLQGMIDRGVELHGHLGPYLVAGIRMGLLALELLECPGYFGLAAVSKAGRKPPLSCLSDGIQIGSGCTAGKGNLSIEDGGEARAHFRTEQGKRLTISLRPEIEREFADGDAHALSERVAKLALEELFQWEKK